MLNTTHTYESINLVEVGATSDTEFELLLENNPLFQPRGTASQTTDTRPQKLVLADQAQIEAFINFHEEFKSLAVAANGTPQSSLQATTAKAAALTYEPNALFDLAATEPVKINPATMAAPTYKMPVPSTVKKTALTPQKVKVIEGPRAGTPPAAEKWLVNLIAMLICLNMLFAALVVSGTRLNEWVSWLH